MTGKETLAQLIRAGYASHLRDTEVFGRSVTFKLTPAGLAKLVMDDRFARGSLHALHSDVGDNLTDFRAPRGLFGKGSLQVVVDRTTRNGFADNDAWNPYTDVWGFAAHGWEVVSNFGRRLFGKGTHA